MILTTEQIVDIVTNNPNKLLLAKARAKNAVLRRHLYGERLEASIATVDGFEEEAMHKLRVKYARSNKDLFARLTRPIDKIFSARGGSVYYNMSDGQNQRAAALASDARDGMSVKAWVEQYWRPHYLDDPSGMVFMEIGDGRNYPVGKVYPTYKQVTAIYDYLAKGVRLEYVVFQLNQDEKKAAGINSDGIIYRVVDDAYDYLVEVKDSKPAILANQTIINYFGKVPAMLNSDLVSPQKDGTMSSVLDEVVELAEHYLLKGSIKITHDFLHGFPKYWEFADDCPNCAGVGIIDGKNCKDCSGTGKSITTKVNQAKLMRYPENGDPVVTPNVAGYISPDRDYYEIATNELSALEAAMNHTLWGHAPQIQQSPLSANQKGSVKTATEVVDDMQPKIDRLTSITASAEKRHKFIIDSMIQVELNQQAYKGASINYGRRFMLEGPDALWDRYTSARSAGASVSVLDDLLLDFLETKYAGDPIGEAIQLKLMKVEPFVHMTAAQVMTLNVDMSDYTAKVYFGEWLTTVQDVYVLVTDVNTLRQDLKTYAATKKMQQEPAPANSNAA